ncbi:DnaJ domain-containing protein [Lactococcus lactis]|uniref:DnaJ domain-containing protein n=1 Tax=Lactococcus lactis TaxID=1358 RepID=UPI0024A9F820|nr:DnaJ domain-containing protein [Lactococcus lactis]
MAELVIISTFYAFILLWKLLKYSVILIYQIIYFILKILANIFAWSLMFPGTKYSGNWEAQKADKDGNYGEYEHKYKYYRTQQKVKAESFYDVLGVSEDDDLATIKKVYRSLSKIYHPDVNNSKLAEEKFKKITDAWEQIQKNRV